MKMVCLSADISDNDISCSEELVESVKKDLYKVRENGASICELTNITGDDMAITAVIPDDNDLEKVNHEIFNIFKTNARGFTDVNGVSETIEDAGEGISYSEIDLDPNFCPDAIIIEFDTYCGEPFVGKVAKSAIQAAKGIDFIGDIDGGCVKDVQKIPEVGYVSNKTDDPIILAAVHNVEQVGVIAGAMIGAILGNKNTYLVRRHTPANVIPGSVIFSVTALMNGNIIDLASPFSYRTRILDE